jgi:ssDNA-binding Zn-finger/Zn-ribbon topoisomerase 1
MLWKVSGVLESEYTVTSCSKCTRALDIVNILKQRIVCSKHPRAKNCAVNTLGLRILWPRIVHIKYTRSSNLPSVCFPVFLGGFHYYY